MAESRLCSIPDCGKRRYAHGWCENHYKLWKRHGDPLVRLRPANGEAAAYLKNVALLYDGDECLIWPFARDENGYGQVKDKGQMRSAHRVVCEEAHGQPPTPKHEAAHSCGRGSAGCVTKRHLSWKTRAGNQQDRVAHGTSNRGERASNAKLTEAQVLEIYALRGKLSLSKIATRYGVTPHAICSIHIGRSWAWLTTPTGILPHPYLE